MSQPTKLTFEALVPAQSENLTVFTFVAKASEIGRVARIERAGRDADGVLQGFQRPQIANHIREIRDYLEKPTAILPNPIVVAFTEGDAAVVIKPGKVTGELTIDISNGAPGWIVDGQQRFTAISEMRGREFEVLVSGFICKTNEELQKQFILINNTRPLPKALVYELLPQVSDLPERMSSRSQAALVTEALNYRKGSSLKGMIRQQTNPKGIIRDTILQRLIMNSLSDGALRLYGSDNKVLLNQGVKLISEYFHAVQHVFDKDWNGQKPTTSRLVHGAGIQAMGYVMDLLNSTTGATTRDEFAAGLRPLIGKTAWRQGEWDFEGEKRRWNSLQILPGDVRQLSFHLTNLVRQAQRAEAA